MTINDLSVGSKVMFGQAIYDGQRNMVIDLVWRKVAENNTFLTDFFVARKAADVPEPDNTSRDRRERGSNFFPQTNIFQWLNADRSGWFSKSHEADVAPDYVNEPGFLSEFAQWEKDAIVPHEIVTIVPEGFRREFGVLCKNTCKVSLPALSEVTRIGDDTYNQEGEFLTYFGTHGRPRMLLRTAVASTLQCIDQYGDAASRSASQRYFIIPKICIKGDMQISDQTDSDGNHVVLPPKGSESCIDVSELYSVLAQ